MKNFQLQDITAIIRQYYLIELNRPQKNENKRNPIPPSSYTLCSHQIVAGTCSYPSWTLDLQDFHSMVTIT